MQWLHMLKHFHFTHLSDTSWRPWSQKVIDGVWSCHAFDQRGLCHSCVIFLSCSDRTGRRECLYLCKNVWGLFENLVAFTLRSWPTYMKIGVPFTCLLKDDAQNIMLGVPLAIIIYYQSDELDIQCWKYFKLDNTQICTVQTEGKWTN